jgi:glycine cleavage system transcriptional repressor
LRREQADKYAGRAHAASGSRHGKRGNQALKEQPKRSRPNENYLLINAFSPREESPLVQLSRRISEAGCNLVEARLATLGQEVCVQALAQGSWDAVAKLESAMARMEREDGLRLLYFRTALREAQGNALPYVVEVTSADKPGVLYQLAEFFEHHGVSIENMSCSRYKALQTGAEIFSAQFTVGIPVDTHIAGLRDDFLEFCDGLNLDAILDPMKF